MRVTDPDTTRKPKPVIPEGLLNRRLPAGVAIPPSGSAIDLGALLADAYKLGQNFTNDVWQNVSGPDMPWNQPLNPEAPANVFKDVPILGGIQNVIGTQFRNAPLGENGAIAMHKRLRDARAQYGIDSPEAQQALEDFGTSAVGVVAGLGPGGGAAGRFKAEPGKGPLGKRLSETYRAEGSAVINTRTGVRYRETATPVEAQAVALRLNATPPKAIKASDAKMAGSGISQTAEQRVAARFAKQAPPPKTVTELIEDLRVASRPEAIEAAANAVHGRVGEVLKSSRQYREAVASGRAVDVDKLANAEAIKQAIIGRRAVADQKTGTVRLSKSERALADAVDSAAKSPNWDDLSTQIAAVSHDPKKLLALTRQMEKPSFWKQLENGIYEYYRGNVLWATGTHSVNFTAGVFQVGAFTTRELLKNPRAAKYLPNLGKGYVEAAANVLPERARQFLSAHVGFFDDLDKNVIFSEVSQKYGGEAIPRGGAIPGIAGEVMRIPFKALSIEDVFQKKPIFNFALKIRAEEVGRSRGLRGKPLREFVDKIPEEVFNDIAEAALKDATEFSLQAPSPVSRDIQGIRNSNLLMKALVLFVNTPYNVTKLGVRLSPVGALRAIPAVLTKEGRARMPNIAAETAIGAATTAAFIGMIGAENMTGLTPKSSAEKQLWEAEGRGPMTIRASEYPMLGPVFRAIYGENADKTWVTGNYLGPLLIPAIVAAAVTEAVASGQEPTAEHAMIAAGNAGRTVLQQVPLFQTYSTADDLLSNFTPDAAGKFLSNLAKPLIPFQSALAQAERLTDGFKRDPKTLEEYLTSIVPGVGQQVRSDYDVLGRPIPVQTGVAGLLARATTENDDPILAEDRFLRGQNPYFVGLTKPSRTIGSGPNKIKLDDDEFNAYERLAGEAKRNALRALLESPNYRAASVAEKSELFEKTEATAQASARRALGIQIASTAVSVDKVVVGMRLATNSGDRYEQGKSLALISDRLTPGAKALYDSQRSQPDPKQDGYDPTADELIRGKQLVDAWLRAPAFSIGTKAQADAAARAAGQYRALRTDAIERGKNPLADKELIQFYAKSANGWLAILYDRDGSRNTRLVSRTRQAIESDVLWDLFESAARNAE